MIKCVKINIDGFDEGFAFVEVDNEELYTPDEFIALFVGGCEIFYSWKEFVSAYEDSDIKENFINDKGQYSLEAFALAYEKCFEKEIDRLKEKINLKYVKK